MKKFLALKASAGSGKTFALTVRYISLLLLGAKENEILTLTFTNKAANEMKERIYKTLLTLGEDSAYLEEIKKQSGLSKEEIMIKKNLLVCSYSNANLSIFTIDKFINKILREFCGYISISDDFEIKFDEEEIMSIKFLQSLKIDDFKLLLNFCIYEKKKYNSLFSLFKNILEKNITNEVKGNINSITYDDSVIQVQKNEIMLFANKIKEIMLNHSVPLTKSAEGLMNFNTFDDLLLKQWIYKESFSEHRNLKKYSNDSLEEFFVNLKNELNNYYKLRAAYSLKKMIYLYEIFEEFKYSYNIKKNYLEFNDVLKLTDKLINEKIDKEFIYFRLDSVYNHILIDEFQDTSLLQYRILEPLIKEIFSGNDEYFRTFFYVGDTKQSIYRFRGGMRELFNYVANTNTLLEVQQLNINYRSCENIVKFVNKGFNTLVNYEYFDQEFNNIESKKGGYVEVATEENLKDKDFTLVSEKINYLIENKVDFNDIAILTYTNDDVISVYNYLKNIFPGMKISTETTSKLINQNNVKALINLVKYFYFKEKIYLENYNAITGRYVDTSIEIAIEEKKKSVSVFLQEMANCFNLVDENIMYFIKECEKYLNIVDFIYEIDKMDASIQSTEQTGLQILTIFKSKGLDFHTVILFDRLKAKNHDRSSLLFNYEDTKLKSVFYKIKNYEFFDKDYNYALEKEKKMQAEDELNIIYVALTRAKNNMIILKKEKNSVFEKLNFENCVMGEIKKSNKKENKDLYVEKINYIPLSLGKQDKQIKEDEEYSEEHLFSKYYGLATHYCLEMMNEFTQEKLAYALRLSFAKYNNYLNENDFKDIYKSLMLLIENKIFQDILKESRVLNEQAILYEGNLKIIDLLLCKNNTYYIYDYKTTNQESYKHIEQVSYYKKAIENIFNTKNVIANLIYIKKDKVLIKKVN